MLEVKCVHCGNIIDWKNTHYRIEVIKIDPNHENKWNWNMDLCNPCYDEIIYKIIQKGLKKI